MSPGTIVVRRPHPGLPARFLGPQPSPFRVNVTLMRLERLNVTFKRNGGGRGAGQAISMIALM
jgi:hypothetical protein